MIGKYQTVYNKISLFMIMGMIVYYWIVIKSMNNQLPQLLVVDGRKQNGEKIVYVEQKWSNLTHIVVPFHVKQLPKLKETISRWSKYKPCTSRMDTNDPKPRLIFFVGHLEPLDTGLLKSNLNELSKNFECFANADRIDVITYEFNKDNDKHVLGSRLMFEHILARKHELIANASYVFYMEPDCRPIRSDWIRALQNEIGLGCSFWSKGSIYRGTQNFVDKYVPNKYHINGNAIYNVGDEKFRHFYFKVLRPFIEKHGDSHNAYDTDFFEYLIDMENHPHVRHIVHKFHFTDVIQNFWMQKYDVAKVAEENPETYIIHGGFPNDY